jgi:hypothetical protein
MPTALFMGKSSRDTAPLAVDEAEDDAIVALLISDLSTIAA